MALSRKAVFLDKDGTLVEDVPYNVDPVKMRLNPGVGEALQRLHDAGFYLIVISNQPGVALGYFKEEALLAVEQRLRALLAAPLTGFYYCPHDPAGTVPRYTQVCACRKPTPGLILAAAKRHRLDLTQSWFVGDILNDVEAGRRAGCRTVLLDNGNETQWHYSPLRIPDRIVKNMTHAASIILGARPVESLRFKVE